MPFMEWESPRKNTTETAPKDQEGRTRLILDIPSCSTLKLSGINEWECVKHINLRYGEKDFILGICSVLQLTKQQKHYLLLIYAEKYQEAYDKEKEINRRGSSGKYHANQWLRRGMSGFINRVAGIE